MDLLRDNLKKLYFKFLIPSLGSAMVMSIYTLTDAIVIGKGVGTDALAALSITTPLLCILMSTGILFGVGGSVQMSVHRGSGNTVKSNRYRVIHDDRSSHRTAVDTVRNMHAITAEAHGCKCHSIPICHVIHALYKYIPAGCSIFQLRSYICEG